MTEERKTDTQEDEAGSAASGAMASASALSEDEAGAGDAGDAVTEHETADDDAPPAGALGVRAFGIERYVQVAYFLLAVALFWVLQQAVVVLWNLFAEPNVGIATAAAAVLAGVTTVLLYKHPRLSELSTDIATELSQVTWPSREETRVSTVVVIVTSIVAAVLLGIFDALWSAITDLVYKV
jgi:preprotein translocase subunit SecE